MSAGARDPLRVALPPHLAAQVRRARPQLGRVLAVGPASGLTWLLPVALAGAAQAAPEAGAALLAGGVGVVGVLLLHAGTWLWRRHSVARDARAATVRGLAKLAGSCNAALAAARVEDARAQAGLGGDAAAAEAVYAICRAARGLVSATDRELRRQPAIGRGGRSTWAGRGGALADHRRDLLRLAGRLVEVEAALPALVAAGAPTPPP